VVHQASRLDKLLEFLKLNFDKLLLSTLFLSGLATFLHFARSMEFYSTTQNSTHLMNVVNWLENTIGQILAALLTLMVGSRFTIPPSPPQPQASVTATDEGASATVGGTTVSTKVKVKGK
jgi:hypothetical protein